MILEGMEYEVQMSCGHIEVRKFSKEKAKLYEGYELITFLGVKGTGDCIECRKKKYSLLSGAVLY